MTETEMGPEQINQGSIEHQVLGQGTKMNQSHDSVGSGLGSDRMASTRVVRAHSRLRQADCGGSALMMQ